MPNKTSRRKSLKGVSKTKVATNKQNFTSNIENHFLQAKKNLVPQITNNLKQLKQRMAQLKTQIQKVTSAKNQAKNKYASLTKQFKKAGSTTVKKQIATTKQVQEQAIKLIKNIQRQLTQLAQQQKSLLQKQVKYIALNKVIGNFEKTWTHQKPAKKTTAAKPKTMTVRPPIIEKTKTVPTQTQMPFSYAPRIENPDNFTNTSDFDESTFK